MICFYLIPSFEDNRLVVLPHSIQKEENIHIKVLAELTKAHATSNF